MSSRSDRHQGGVGHAGRDQEKFDCGTITSLNFHFGRVSPDVTAGEIHTLNLMIYSHKEKTHSFFPLECF